MELISLDLSLNWLDARTVQYVITSSERRRRSCTKFEPVLITRIPAVSYLQDDVFGVIIYPTEVKMGCLSENVLAGCNVTENKCSRIM